MDLRTQQPTLISLDRLHHALQRDGWTAEEKIDAHRLHVICTGGRIDPRNRHGQPYKARPLPAPLRQALAALPDPTWVDGEFEGTRLHVFDLRVCGRDLHAAPWTERRDQLEQLAADHGFDIADDTTSLPDPAADLDPAADGASQPQPADLPPLRLVPTRRDLVGRLELTQQLLAAGAEGVVLKDVTAPYTPGRTTSWLKAKFTLTIRAVAGAPARGVVPVLLHDPAGERHDVGTAAVGRLAVTAGQVIAVRCRPSPDGGRLREAVVTAVHADADPAACTLDQLPARPDS